MSSLTCCDRRRWVSDGIKNIFEIGCHLLDLLSHLLIPIIKDVFGTIGSNKVRMSWAAGGYDIEAIQRCDLNGVETNTC